MKCRKYIAVLVALALTTNTMWATAASIVPDTRNGQGPIIDQAANGVPVVQIKNPNDKGLSHNQYLDLNVGNKGLILNNANKNVSTELAGFIAANPTMGAYPAKQILNEVTGTSRTAIGGAIEVAGNKADVIIANPNGILVNNGTFINTGNVMLTTGMPIINNGNISSYDVRDGVVTVDGQGLNASQTPHTDILAKSIEVNAGIWANDLRMVTGKNTVKADTLVIQQ